MKRRNTLWLLLGVGVTIAVILLVAYDYRTGRIPAVLYRYSGSGGWLYSTLRHGVRNGDTIEEVERVLGPGKEGDIKIRNATKRLGQKFPDLCSDGYEDRDRMLGWKLPGGELYLQFRDGVLINFDPTHFEKYEPTTVIGP